MEYLHGLPISSGASRHFEVLELIEPVGAPQQVFERCEPWGLKGIFVYTTVDDPARSLPYERMISPSRPLNVSILPEPIRLMIGRIQILTRSADTQKVTFELTSI
jgi:hypothetical protein